jgi:hypothetical protein
MNSKVTFLIVCLGSLRAAIAPAQTISPVFEHLFTEASPLPILKAQGVGTVEEDRFDGTSPMDSYGGFHRYDAGRLMLGVRENGINESDPGHDTALAAAYPDRSLLWIDAQTGAPQGVAIQVGLRPVPLDAEFLARGGTEIDFYFDFGVAADGVVYVGYKNKILRYAPNGEGGFNAPTVAYTHEDDGSANWHQWRWENIRVTGAGAETVILAGGKTWRPNQGYHRLTTTDGITFSKADPTQDIAAGGGASSVISGRVPAEPDSDWVYVTLYPGSSNGIDSRFNRQVGDPEAFLPFANDGTFAAQRDPIANPETDYVSEFISDVDGDSTLGYVVAYSTPSWNSKAVGRIPTRPGFLAVHAHDGSLLGSHTLEVTEDQEIVGDPAAENATSQFHGALGALEVNVLDGMKAGQAEVLWYSGIYGFGRYLVGSAAPAPETPTLRIARAGGGIEITWEGGGTLESAGAVAGPWTAVAGSASPYSTGTSESARYYRVSK